MPRCPFPYRITRDGSQILFDAASHGRTFRLAALVIVSPEEGGLLITRLEPLFSFLVGGELEVLRQARAFRLTGDESAALIRPVVSRDRRVEFIGQYGVSHGIVQISDSEPVEAVIWEEPSEQALQVYGSEDRVREAALMAWENQTSESPIVFDPTDTLEVGGDIHPVADTAQRRIYFRGPLHDYLTLTVAEHHSGYLSFHAPGYEPIPSVIYERYGSWEGVVYAAQQAWPLRLPSEGRHQREKGPPNFFDYINGDP